MVPPFSIAIEPQPLKISYLIVSEFCLINIEIIR